MNKKLTVTFVALAAITLGFSALSPALATHADNHNQNMYWYKEYCSTDNLCTVFVDMDRDGVCNVLTDAFREMPRGFVQRLDVFSEDCNLVF